MPLRAGHALFLNFSLCSLYLCILDIVRCIRYKLLLLKPCSKALSQSTKVSLRVDHRGFLSLQCMIPTEDKQVCFVEFLVSWFSCPGPYSKRRRSRYDIIYTSPVYNHRLSTIVLSLSCSVYLTKKSPTTEKYVAKLIFMCMDQPRPNAFTAWSQDPKNIPKHVYV